VADHISGRQRVCSEQWPRKSRSLDELTDTRGSVLDDGQKLVRVMAKANRDIELAVVLDVVPLDLSALLSGVMNRGDETFEPTPLLLQEWSSIRCASAAP
jgi:hypothetical protein